MKRLIYIYGIIGLLLGLFQACVGDDDYSLPDKIENQIELKGDTLSIEQVKAIFIQESGYFGALSGGEQFTFHDTTDYMVGYVISSDESGNFYQELVLQDALENPTSGIKILIQADPLYTRFELGQKVYVELKGFTIGFSNGVMALGLPEASNDFIGKAPKTYLKKLIRTTEVEEISPLPLTMSEVFSGDFDLLYVKLDNLQFEEEVTSQNLTIAGEAEDYFDAERFMESCASTKRLYLLTSTFSDFKSWRLPHGNGEITGIVVKTFNGSDYALKINYPDQLSFTGERCTPQEEEEGNGQPSTGEEEIFPTEEDQLAFTGADFENWDAFINGLNSSGVPKYVSQAEGKGVLESAALHIKTDEQTTAANDYIFIAPPVTSFPSEYNQISFFLKGVADKSISINLYKSDGSYYKFNLKTISKSTRLSPVGSNQYTGKIDTKDKWIKVSLDVSRISDLNSTDTNSDFLALKIGKNADYDVYLDHFMVE